MSKKQPQKQRRTIIVETWTCYNRDHRHALKSAAQKCIDKHERRTGNPIAWRTTDAGKKGIIDFLCGERATVVAGRLGVKAVSVKSAGYAHVKSLYSDDNWHSTMIALAREPGIGQVKAARIMFAKLCER